MSMGTNDNLSGRQWKLGTSQFVICKCISSVASKWSATNALSKYQGIGLLRAVKLPFLFAYLYIT